MNIFGKQGKNADLKKSIGLEGLENELSELTGLPVKISYNGIKGSGKISINFNEIDSIQYLVNQLKND